MKLRHNAHPQWQRPSASSEPIYDAEVLRSTERSERLYAQLEHRLAKATIRLDRAKASPRAASRKQQIAELEMVVELRRLERYRRMMVSVPASLEHRGTKGYRPIGYGGTP